MAYAIYTTEAIVCGSKDSYTSDRSYLLFTQRAGMLWAGAKSVRTEKSKQRQALQEFSIIRVSLVKGRSGWRIGSVEAISNPFMRADSREARGVVQVVVRHLRRFLHGEESVPAIFADAKETLMLAEDGIEELDQIFTLRLLHQLGYIKSEPVFSSLFEGEIKEKIEEAFPLLATAAIDRALKASHL